MIYRNRQQYIQDAIDPLIALARDALWKKASGREAAPVLFVGNGVSRMIADAPGWDGLFRRLWMDSGVPWLGQNVRSHYDLASKNLNYAERASYLLNNLEPADREGVLRDLYMATECADPAKSALAGVLLNNFPVIVTTNFDNLLERQARLHGIAYDQIVLAPGRSTDGDSYRPDHPGDSTSKPTLIVKIHGSFKFEAKPTRKTFAAWWAKYAKSKFEDELVLTFEAYQRRMRRHNDLYRKLAKRMRDYLPSAKEVSALILGYGLAFDDMSITAFLQRIAQGPLGVVEFGADSVYRHRALGQWGVHADAAILIPEHFGAGLSYRRWAYEYTLRRLIGAPVDDLLRAPASPRSALVLGQSSVNYVARLGEMPQAERSYFLQKTKRVPAQYGELRDAAWADPSIKTGEAIQVGGQMLVPVSMLDALGHPAHFVSVIADDEHGERIKAYLKWKTENLDWSLVCSLPPWNVTEHAYVLSVSGVRTLLDYAQLKLDKDILFRIESQPDNAAHRAKVGELSEKVADKFHSSGPGDPLTPNLGVVYLSKWFAIELAPAFRAIKATSPDVRFVYETGTRGSPELRNTPGDGRPEPVEAVLGGLVDVTLGSSLFAARLGMIDYANALTMPPDECPGAPIPQLASIAMFDYEWERLSSAFGEILAVKMRQRRARERDQAEPGRAHYELASSLQMHAFILLLARFGPGSVHDLLFKNPLGLFPKMQHFAVSLGGDGAMLFHREVRDRVLWATGPSAEKIDASEKRSILGEISTLGCGDVARSGYLSALLDAMPMGDPLAKAAFDRAGAAGGLLRRFGAMGAMKSRFLDVEVALEFVKKQRQRWPVEAEEQRAALTDELVRLLKLGLVEITDDPAVYGRIAHDRRKYILAPIRRIVKRRRRLSRKEERAPSPPS